MEYRPKRRKLSEPTPEMMDAAEWAIRILAAGLGVPVQPEPGYVLEWAVRFTDASMDLAAVRRCVGQWLAEKTHFPNPKEIVGLAFAEGWFAALDAVGIPRTGWHIPAGWDAG